MTSNLDRYKEDLKKLVRKGNELLLAVYAEVYPESAQKTTEKLELPNPRNEYQRWYSEAVALIEQLMPRRVPDFVGHYERPKNRKEVNGDTYRIQDYLLGM
jgi:hypothetical protein